MALTLPQPPAWWVKYKPLRWLLGALLLYWLAGQLLALRPDAAPEPPATAEPPAIPAPAAEPAETTATTPPQKPGQSPVPVPVPAQPAPKAAPTPSPAPVETTQAAAEPAVDPSADPPADSEAETEPVLLINGLRSYASLLAVRTLLQKDGHAVQEKTIERRTSNGDPPFRNDTLQIENYRHGEHAGKLTLEFFNDRLYQAYFEPQQAPEYLAWLRAQGLALPKKRTGNSVLIRGSLEVRTNIDFASSDVGQVMGSKPFLQWEDLRLVQQMKDWSPQR